MCLNGKCETRWDQKNGCILLGIIFDNNSVVYFIFVCILALCTIFNSSLHFREDGIKCVCNDGFKLSSDGKSCEDFDECAENPFVCLHGRCHNTEGICKLTKN